MQTHEGTDRVDWRAPPGAWSRNFRLGEWLPGPVTPLFATWLLPGIEAALSEWFRREFGFRPRPPHHAIVNGWYFASLNFLPATAGDLVTTLALEFLPRFVRRPRWTSVALPPLAGLGVDAHARAWREQVSPAYRETVRSAGERVSGASDATLCAIVDDLSSAAGEYFGSLVVVAGYAWKAELPLAEFVREHCPGVSHLPLLVGLGAPDATAHAVASLDWYQPTLSEMSPRRTVSGARTAQLSRAREQAECATRASLRSRREVARFDALLARAQQYARLREEQVLEWTLPWPVLRRAVNRLGESLVARGALERVEQVFFVTRSEIDGAVAALSALADARRAEWDTQRTLVPPLEIGAVPPMLSVAGNRAAALFERARGDGVITGIGASPGRATGAVRVVRGPDGFDGFQPGEVLVAPATAPAWTQLFPRAAAVVTDAGSLLSHASVVAREFGIPSVVGTRDATRRLRDGARVVVDGAAGTVSLENG